MNCSIKFAKIKQGQSSFQLCTNREKRLLPESRFLV
jgi:hypothetical protein